MKMTWTIALATAVICGSAVAQDQTTGDPVYTDRVIGADGVAYNCRPDPIEQNGQLARSCVRAESGGLAGEGSIGTPAAVGAGVLAVGAVVGGSSSSTTTTTTN